MESKAAKNQASGKRRGRLPQGSPARGGTACRKASAVKSSGSSLFEVGEVKQEVKNMELKNSGKRGWKRRVPNHRAIICGTPEP
jgi:hypothetical protein